MRQLIQYLRYPRRIALGLALGWTALTGGAFARDLDQLLPEQAVVRIEFRDVPGLIERWEASPLARVWGDERLARLLAPARARVAALEKGLAGEPGGLRGALAQCTGGAVLAGVLDPAGGEQPLRWILLFEHGDAVRARRLLGRAAVIGRGRVEQLAAQGEFSAEHLRVVEEREAAPTEPGGELAGLPGVTTVKRQVIAEHRLWVGPDLALHVPGDGAMAAAILDRVRAGAAPTGAETLLDRSDVRVTVDLAGVVKWLQAAPGRLELPLGLDVRTLALDALQGFELEAALRGDRIEARARLTARTPVGGATALLFMADKSIGEESAAFRDLLPEGTQWLALQRMPAMRLWDTMLELLAQGRPAVAALVATQAAAFQQATGLSLREDVLGHLGGAVGRIGMAGEARDAATSAWLLRVERPEIFQRGLTTLLNFGSRAYGAYQLESRPLAGGGHLWMVRAGRPSSGFAGKPLVHFLLHDEWLAVARDGGAIARIAARMQDQDEGGAAAAPADDADPAADGLVWATPRGLLQRLAEGTFPTVIAEPKPGAAARWFDAASVAEGEALDEFFGDFTASHTASPGAVQWRMRLMFAE